MKAPLEQLDSSTPMSVSEGLTYTLIAGALIGFGVLLGWTRASIRSNRRDEEDYRGELRNTRRRNNQQNQNRKPS
jgi:hypothetical protein